MDSSAHPAWRWFARGSIALIILALLVTAAGLTLGHEPTTLQTGTIESPSNSTTIVGIQGFHFQGEGDKKKPARLIAANATGNITWTYNGSKRGATWFYDVDPLPNGNVLAVNTEPGTTLVYELDPATKQRVWTEEFNITDTHDVDLINEDELLVANLRNSRNGTSHDQVFIYNRTQDRIVWEWKFRNHYPLDTDDGATAEDWSHVNDVDKIGPGRYLVSPRNFDQVIVVNRSTKAIEMRLGADGNHSTLNEQHNPTYLESENGTPALLVADSENDRVVEYAYQDGEWVEVWELGTDRLNWPRDADRLPNGNTLIVDTMNHRVIEVTPTGEIVWEAYTPWAPYDVERLVYGDEAGGPTMQDMNTSGSYEFNGSAGLAPGTGKDVTFPTWLQTTFEETPVEGSVNWFAEEWEGVSQWVKPIWMPSWTLVALITALILLLGWGVAELIYRQRRIRRERKQPQMR
jgi:hypothetical protein